MQRSKLLNTSHLKPLYWHSPMNRVSSNWRTDHQHLCCSGQLLNTSYLKPLYWHSPVNRVSSNWHTDHQHQCCSGQLLNTSHLKPLYWHSPVNRVSSNWRTDHQHQCCSGPQALTKCGRWHGGRWRIHPHQADGCDNVWLCLHPELSFKQKSVLIHIQLSTPVLDPCIMKQVHFVH